MMLEIYVLERVFWVAFVVVFVWYKCARRSLILVYMMLEIHVLDLHLGIRFVYDKPPSHGLLGRYGPGRGQCM